MPFGFPEGSPFEEFFERFGEQFGGHDRSPGAPQRATALGSGFIIDATGYVVTNNHVIDGASEVSVRLSAETVYPARVVGPDSATDLALPKETTPQPESR